jgi:hypothetical protein
MGIDWWSDNAMFRGLSQTEGAAALPAPAPATAALPSSASASTSTAAIEDRLARVEALLLKQTAALEGSR